MSVHGIFGESRNLTVSQLINASARTPRSATEISEYVKAMRARD